MYIPRSSDKMLPKLGQMTEIWKITLAHLYMKCLYVVVGFSWFTRAGT